MSTGPTSSVRSVVSELAARRVSAVELAEQALAAQVPGAIEQRLDEALEEARRSDRRRAAGALLSRLDGVPFGVKANIDLAGVVTTNGTGLSLPRADRDAAAVETLRGAGLIPVLTTTMAEAAVGAVTVNPHTGSCPSPRHPHLNAGGSSGGSAAVVAAGVVPMALGSDTMGSVRVPAAYCGIAGFKPSRGAIDTRGLAPLGGMLDTVGVLAGQPGDVGLVADLLLAPAGEAAPVKGALVAVPALVERADAESRAALDAAVAGLVALGATVVTSTGPAIDPAQVRRLGLLQCEFVLLQDYEQAYASGDPGLSPQLRRLLDYAAALPDRESRMRRVGAELAELSESLRAAVSGFDALVLPVTPGPVPALDEDPPNAADLTAWVNVAGLPAVTLPSWEDHRPAAPGASVQLVGRPGADRQVLDLAVRLDELSR